MKKVISLFLSLAMLLSIVSVVNFSAFADVQTGSCGDNVTYSLDTKTGVLTISGTGGMADYSNFHSPFYERTNIKSVSIEDGVTSIGRLAFENCKSLTSVTIGNSVTSIGVGAFFDCTNLTSIAIPDCVTSIGDSAFFGCTNLTSIAIPDCVTSIGSSAFSGCRTLNSVTIPNSVTSIGWSAFLNTAYYNDESNWDNGVLYLSNCLIDTNDDFDSTTDYTIKDGTRIIAENAFFFCQSLTDVTIPNSVTNIGNLAFNGCGNLTSVTIPNSVTSIGRYVFENCGSLINATIPDSVTSIGEGPFWNCTSLTSIEVSCDNENYSSQDDILFNKDKSELITYPAGKADSEYAIPNSVTSISAFAFSGCTSLTSITIPDSVTSIGGGAFSGCTSLASVTIPNNVKSIGHSAFRNCTSLKDVYYAGTEDEWNKIRIGDFNEDLINATIHFASTPISNPAPQPSTQPTQDSPQQAAQQTTQQQSTQNDTTTEQVSVAKPKSVSPKTVKAAKKAILVTWKKVSGVKGYQVQVATDKKFKKNKKTVNIKKQKTTKTTVKKLKAKKKYYVRIRTYKIVNGKKVYSSWSKVKSVKTK